MIRTSTPLLVMFGIGCGQALSAQDASQNVGQWKQQAEEHVSRIRALALPTAFTPISVHVPKSFRDWIPINDAAQASVHTGSGPRPNPPQGEIPLFVQLTKIRVAGLSISRSGNPSMWSSTERKENGPSGLVPHWWFRELLSVDKLNAELQLRVGDGRGLISPVFDVEVKIEDARVPFNIHALKETCMQSNPVQRSEEFVIGRITLESKNLPLPPKMQRKLSESLTADLAGPVVGDIPLHVFGLPVLPE